MIEYALVLSLYLMMMFGFVQFALILFGFNNATYASRVAVRYAVVHGSTAIYTCTATDISNIITPLLWRTVWRHHHHNNLVSQQYAGQHG